MTSNQATVGAPAKRSPDWTVATVGLHGSASTWVFNIARELMSATFGEDQVVTCYADTLAELPAATARAGRHLVLKSHHGSAELDAWLHQRNARIVLSVRDPRDACISMAQRFGSPFNHTARWVANDCVRMQRLAAEGHLVLRYEDRFFDNLAAVEWVAQALGLPLAPGQASLLHARYATAAVRAFASRLAELPPERITEVAGFKMDRVTQILGPHIGDGRVGKWRELPGDIQRELTRFHGPFLDRFGYPR